MCLSACVENNASQKQRTLDLHDSPNLPNIARVILKKTVLVEHSPQAAWFQSWRCLHYDRMKDIRSTASTVSRDLKRIEKGENT